MTALLREGPDSDRIVLTHQTDHLSEFLDSLHVNAALVMRLGFDGPFAFRKHALEGIPFRLVEGRPCWLKVAGADWLPVHPGDVILLPHGDEHIMASSPEVPPVELKRLAAAYSSGDHEGHAAPAKNDNFIDFGRRDAPASVIGCVIGVRDPARNPILEGMGRVIHLRAGVPNGISCYMAALQTLIDEAAELSAGWHIAVCKIAEAILIQALRAHFMEAAATSPGWFRGMQDPKIGKALLMMHRCIRTSIDVESLAQAAGMSRSRFSAAFTDLLGCSPMVYLSRLRLAQAAERLSLGHTVANVAEGAGYASEKSFSRAFSRWTGDSPGRFRRSRISA